MLIRSFAGAAALLLFAAGAILASSGAAEAAVYIAYVAANGNNANPCTVATAPCRTLQRAVNVATTNATVRVLTPLQGGAIITRSITIEGSGATVVGAIVVNSPSAVVTLRGLALNGVGSFVSGIRVDSAAAMHIEDCTVEHYTNDGIKFIASTATKLFVSNTVSRANGSDGLYADDLNALAEIRDSRFEGNASTGLFLKVKTASVLQSTSSGNVQNGIILRSPNAKVAGTTANDNGSQGLYSDDTTAKVQIENSRFEGNGSSGLSLQVAKASVFQSVASGNAGDGIVLRAASAKISETTADNNSGYGFSVLSGTALMSSAEANGDGPISGNAYGALVANGATMGISNSVFLIDNKGFLYSYKNNVGSAPNSTVHLVDQF